MIKILLCCSAGMSSSILVKNMREAASQAEIDCAIASISVIQLEQYILKSDLVLIAPQCAHEFERIKKIATPYSIPVFLIGRKEYGEMNGNKVLIRALKRIEFQQEELKMDRISGFIERKIMPIALKVGSNRTLTIIRNAMCAAMALLIIGSVSILLASIPYEPVAKVLEPVAPFFTAINACTTGILALFIAGAMGYYGAEAFNVNRWSNVVTSTSAFVLTQYNLETGIDISGFGTSGLLTAIVVGYITVRILALFEQKNWGIKMPDGVPPAVSHSFSSLIPATIVMTLFGIIAIVFKFNLNTFMATLMSPVSSLLQTSWGYALYHSLMGLVFFCGINSAVVCDVAYPFLLANGVANEAAIAAGKAPIFAATYGTDTMIWAGGTGATIGLMILMTFIAKSQYFKTLGRMSIGPGIFNINEPIIFGTPICFNPLFLLPFVILPGVLAFTTVTLMETGIIAMPTVSMVPWTTPPVIIGFIMTSGAWSTTIWALIIVIISVVVYYPFFRIADKQQYAKEINESQSELNDNLEAGV
ncbi:PTS transporter subunit EIIC [Candidatus Stoquefichus massiliensis]|uniref:PTS transporter subunit EIIC n=1 Tax=Candidatus Stoquefichus massiliensis TaxID=1470350 RepID=UPI0004B50178|nr:PTS transporter subunit EIIC [Candidatus Stoquefichus massiliensis]